MNFASTWEVIANLKIFKVLNQISTQGQPV